MIIAILLTVFGAMLVGAYALWELGGEQLVVRLGAFVLRVVTFGRIRIASDADETTAIAVAAGIVILIFLIFVLIAARLAQ